MNVLLVTSWNRPQCGIQAHSEMLIAEMEYQPDITITPSEEALDPRVVFAMAPTPDVLHLNYHRALHSRWTVEYVRRAKNFWGCATVVTFHDTFGELPPDQLSQDLCAVADAFIVHEPCCGPGLEQAIYWRMGVPEPSGLTGYGEYRSRPYLGTVGFDFPWKNVTEQARAAASVGWGYCLCTPEMSDAREAELRAINPWLEVYRNLNTDMVVATLHQCDATAFTNVCGNSGQSAAILLGIAARKPVIAFSTCRQYRALVLADDYQHIIWIETFEALRDALRYMPCERFDTGSVELAERDSWRHLGVKHADLYRRLIA